MDCTWRTAAIRWEPRPTFVRSPMMLASSAIVTCCGLPGAPAPRSSVEAAPALPERGSAGSLDHTSLIGPNRQLESNKLGLVDTHHEVRVLP